MGEKVTVTELAPRPSAESVRASGALLMAAARLRSSSPEGSNQPPSMKYLGRGHALVACRQDVLPTEDLTNMWPGLSAMIAENQDALADVREALEAPVLFFDLDYRQGLNLLLPHLARLKGISQWLAAATILDLHDGRTTNAWENLAALTALVARYNREPVIISELVRVAMSQIALNTTWETLQSTAGPEEQLQQVQAAWESMDLLAQAEGALAMARAVDRMEFAQWRQSYPAVLTGGSASLGLADLAELGKEVIENPKAALRDLVGRYPGYWAWKYWQSYDEELADARMLQTALETLRTVGKDAPLGRALKQFEQGGARVRRENPPAGNWFGYSLASGDGISKFLSRIASLEIQRSLLVAAIALKRYQLRHGVYPAELSALMPECLSGVPRDPMDGKPLRYQLNPDGSFVLYSVGENGVDDGGDPSPPPQTPNSRRWWQARDAVWPQPATPAEVSAEFGKLAVARKSAAAAAPTSVEMERFLRRYGAPPTGSAATNAGTNK